MKKYIKPATSIARVVAEELAAASDLERHDESGDDYTPHGKQNSLEFEETDEDTEESYNIWE